MLEGLPPRPSLPPRPHITVILAMSADGKIADARRAAARFPSLADKAHLEAQIAKADATLFGATTLRAYGTTLSITNPDLLAQRHQQNLPAQPIQIVCSATGNLDPSWRFFSQPIPRWLITTLEGIQTWQLAIDRSEISLSPYRLSSASRYQQQGNQQQGNQQQSKQILTKPFQHTFITERPFNWHNVLKDLRIGTRALSTTSSRAPIRRLLVMGGGELVASLLADHLIDELYLTVCPLLIGGKTAPSPVGGLGFTLPNTPQLQLQSARTEGDEVFLHYTVRHDASSR
ncbi:MAG: RibD family protein [Cyanobacteria bacterium P01_D01_bin.105]